jgi:hypothetical protein
VSDTPEKRRRVVENRILQRKLSSKTTLDSTLFESAFPRFESTPAAIQFWKDYKLYRRTFHPLIPVFINTQKGSQAGEVWPSFYDNHLRNNARAPMRKRIQIVHVDTANYVALFVEKVACRDFVSAVSGLLEDGMSFGDAGGSWQSVGVPVPSIDPCLPLAHQTQALGQVFRAAPNACINSSFSMRQPC